MSRSLIGGVLLTTVAALFTIYPGPSKQLSSQVQANMSFRKEHATPFGPLGDNQKVLPFGKGLRPVGVYMSAFAPVGVTVADFDGDGTAAELCVADPFRGQAGLVPVPGKNSGFREFTFERESLPFESSTMLPTGCLAGDFNHDGLTDAMIYYFGRSPIVWLWNGQGLTAENFRPAEVIYPHETWFTMSATTADVDGDGLLDVIAGNYFPDQAAIFDDRASAPAEMNSSYGVSDNGAYNRLLLGQKAEEALFKEAKSAFHEAGGTQWTVAVGAADLDGDLLPEIYFANDHGPDQLLHNRSLPGKPQFQVALGQRNLLTPRSKVMGRDAFHGMGIDFKDINRDGHLDFMISNITGYYTLHESHFFWQHTGSNDLFSNGIAPFRDRSESLGIARSGWAWDLKFADFDHDGLSEIVQATGFLRGKHNRVPEAHEMALGNDFFLRHPEVWHRFSTDDEMAGSDPLAFFVRDSDGVYKNFGSSLGMNEPDVSRAIATADVDNDGDLDFIVGNQRKGLTLYENQSKKNGLYLSLNLRVAHAPANPAAIVVKEGYLPIASLPRGRTAVGAKVTITAPDGNPSIATVDGGNGFCGKRDGIIHEGLGSITEQTELQVKVEWRDTAGTAHEQTLKLKPGHYTLQLGSVEGFAGVNK